MDGTGDSLLKNVSFVQLWVGQGISFVGDAVSMVALVVLVVQITGRASAVGGVLVAYLLPTLASPLAGVLADRLDRRIILVASDLARAVLVLGLVFIRDLVVIYSLLFLMGLSRTLFNPTIRAGFPSVVGEGDLVRANALVSGAFSVSITVGPALGGLLVAAVGVSVAFALDAATFLISAALLARVPMPRSGVGDNTGFARELRGGFAYLARTRIPLAIVGGTFLVVLTVNITVPSEVFLARETFGAGDAGYGLLVGLWGGGMVLGSALIAVLGNRGTPMVPLYFLSIFTLALALVGTGLSPTFIFALSAVAVAGIANGLDNVTTDTILQRQVPEALLGRTFAVRFLSFSAGEAIAYLAGGLIVDAVGPRFTYLLAGIATAAAGLLILGFLTVTSAKKGQDR